MSSILNSISPGGLRAQEVPGATPKNDSIIDILKNSEIEFNTCPTFKNNVSNFNTGFGDNGDLHYKLPCSKPKLITPLYRENYLHEFETEEEKAQARHALGLYNKGDIVAMSLLTAEDSVSPNLNWSEVPLKELRKGDKPFAPITSFSAVFDSSGVSLATRIKTIQTSLTEQQKVFNTLIQPTNSKQISSLGDVKLFLEGFNNGDNLKEQIDLINQEMLRFEKSGQINE